MFGEPVFPDLGVLASIASYIGLFTMAVGWFICMGLMCYFALDVVKQLRLIATMLGGLPAWVIGKIVK